MFKLEHDKDTQIVKYTNDISQLNYILQSKTDTIRGYQQNINMPNVLPLGFNGQNNTLATYVNNSQNNADQNNTLATYINNPQTNLVPYNTTSQTNSEHINNEQTIQNSVPNMAINMTHLSN